MPPASYFEDLDTDKLIVVRALNFRQEWKPFLKYIKPNGFRKEFLKRYIEYFKLIDVRKKIETENSSFYENNESVKDLKELKDEILNVYTHFFDSNDPLIRFLNENAALLLSQITDIDPYLHAIETVGGPDIVTLTDLDIGYSCWRYEKKDKEYDGKKMYAFQVMIEASNRILDRIESVTYRLSETYPNHVRKVIDRSTRFALKELAWGSSTVYTEVKIRGQDTTINLSHPIDLAECQ